MASGDRLVAAVPSHGKAAYVATLGPMPFDGKRMIYRGFDLLFDG